MPAPNPEALYIKQFCQGISGTAPISIEHCPIQGVPLNQCFNIVKQHVATHGGKAVTGWKIREWPSVLIEAEFHAVWQSHDHALIDIVPDPEPLDFITFLPDPKSKYRGVQVDNIRKPLSNSLTVKRLISAHKAMFREMNRGDLAYQHREIKPTPKMIKLENTIRKLHWQVVRKYGTSRWANRD